MFLDFRDREELSKNFAFKAKSTSNIKANAISYEEDSNFYGLCINFYPSQMAKVSLYY